MTERTRFFSNATRIIGLIGLLALTVAMAGGVTPTDRWVDYYGTDATYLGQPVEAGAVIAAYDPQGVQCGEFTVATEGQYGLMPCYGDDGTTSEDEGAQAGDVIRFRIDGLPARRSRWI